MADAQPEAIPGHKEGTSLTRGEERAKWTGGGRSRERLALW